MSEYSESVTVASNYIQTVFGQFDANIKKIEKEYSVSMILRDDKLKVSGSEEGVKKSIHVIEQLFQMADRGSSIDEQKVDYTISIVNEHPQEAKESLAELDRDIICHTMSGKPIKPKTVGQRTYVNSIEKSMIVFGVGPAGTGKTYLAMAKAITAFKNNEVGRIILTRPAIEAGEKLGFLPGDLQSKVDPYLRPLYDALYEIMGADAFMKNMEKGLIEVAPLAYMRGRTLDNAYIVLDEAQTTAHDAQSGLDVALKVLKDIDDISICHLTSLDVVRHPLVQKIVNAYEKYEDKRSRQAKPRKTTTAQKNRGK